MGKASFEDFSYIAKTIVSLRTLLLQVTEILTKAGFVFFFKGDLFRDKAVFMVSQAWCLMPL